MSVQKILYEDKETFQTSERDEINKATAANYNEIKDVVNFNADELDSIIGGTWVPALTTGDVSAIQNIVTSDITGQTGTKTFDGINWDITTSGRTSTGEVNFLNFKKDTVDKFKVSVDGLITVATGTSAGLVFGDGDSGFFENVDDRIFIKISGTSNWEIRQGKFSAFTGTGGISIKPNVGSVTLPAFTFRGDEDTGRRWVSADVMQDVTGGIAVLTYDASQNVTMENGKFFTVASTTLAAINVGSFAGDPSALIDGDYWTNSTTNKLRARQNGVSVDVIGGGFANNANNAQLAKSDGTDLIDSGISIPSNGNLDLSGSIAILGNSTTNGSVDIRPDGSGDIQLTRTNDAGSRLIMQNASGGVSFENNATGLGFFNTTPIAQPSAYTRNATIVEDKTLLASASATTINNNNILAALINDLQLLGLVG